MSSLSDRIPEFEAAIGRFARQRPDRVEPTLASSAPPEAAPDARDAEMRDVVEKFEELFAELAPPPPKSGGEAIQPDDIRLDLPEDLLASSPGRMTGKRHAGANDAPQRTPAPEIPPADAVRPRHRRLVASDR